MKREGADARSEKNLPYVRSLDHAVQKAVIAFSANPNQTEFTFFLNGFEMKSDRWGTLVIAQGAGNKDVLDVYKQQFAEKFVELNTPDNIRAIIVEEKFDTLRGKVKHDLAHLQNLMEEFPERNALHEREHIVALMESVHNTLNHIPQRRDSE